jgi:D-alanine--poly(phosphoribitol) ligase subunit 2
VAGDEAVTAVEARIGRLFVERLNLDVPADGVDLFEVGLLDSLAFVQLLVGLEEEFGIRLSLEEIDVDSFRSVGKIAAFVAERLGGRR